jgi:uncharacterized protein
MIGTFINVGTVLTGGLLGLVLGKRFTPQLNQALMTVLGLSTMVIGAQMGFESNNLLVVIVCLVIGTIIGELLDIHRRLETIGDLVKTKLVKTKQTTFTEALVTTTVLFCVGPMTILGSLQDGLTGNYQLLATKAVLDGVSAILFASSLGVGVLFSSITILIIQGGLTLFAGVLNQIMTEAVIAELTGAGGIMVLGISLGLLGLKKVKVANMLPTLLIIPIVVLLASALGLL